MGDFKMQIVIFLLPAGSFLIRHFDDLRAALGAILAQSTKYYLKYNSCNFTEMFFP